VSKETKVNASYSTVEYQGKKLVLVPQVQFYVLTGFLIFNLVLDIPGAIAWWQRVLS